MRKAMEKWLDRFHQSFSIDTANSICNSLGLDGEKVDECLGFCYQLEKGEINEADFTGGLCVLTGKKPEEVVGILRNVKAGSQVPENVVEALKMAHGKRPGLPGALLDWNRKFGKIIGSMSPEEYKLYLDLLHTPEGYVITEVINDPKKD